MLPLIVKGKEIGKLAKVNPQAKYLVFVDRKMIDARAMADDPTSPIPAGTPIYNVWRCSGDSLDDAIRIFELKEG